MSDLSLPLSLKVAIGMSGAGKSHLCYRYLYAAPGIACRFIFDDLDRASTHYRVRPCETADECEAALETRWVVFRPHKMFPDDFPKAFRWFCDWTLDACKRGPGKKLILLEEIWQWCNPHQIPRELSSLINVGRPEGTEVIINTMWPHKLHSGITGACTEAIFFRTDERLALEAITGIGGNAEEIQKLPLRKFVALNRLTRSVLRGQVP